MSDKILPRKTLGGWLRRHSLTLVAALGGAAGVAYAAGWHAKSTAPVPISVAMAATPTTKKIAEPPRDTVQDTVQIALLLDTSGSMGGLINQARSQLWNMVDQMGRMTRLVDGKLRGVKVELALYEYGNDRLSAQNGFIRQVSPFSTDLDKVSEALHGLSTNGGSEYVGQVIQTAANQLQWSPDPSALRFIFVAGNEEFNQGPISADTAMMAAARKDIHVQLIYCGGKEPTWESAAKLAMSDLMTIDQNQVAQHIPSPQDDDILRLGTELNNTYMAYGNDGAASAARQAKADASSAAISPKVALERAKIKSSKSYSNANWDIVDAVNNNGKFLEQANDNELPAEMRGKTLAEKQQIVAGNAARRAELQAKISKLEAERTRFLEVKRAKTSADQPQMLETELMKSTKKVATKKGYKF